MEVRWSWNVLTFVWMERTAASKTSVSSTRVEPMRSTEGSYETNVLKRFQQFAKSPTLLRESLQLFTLIALNCAIRNGDAHLKNFGIVYENVTG